MYKIPIAGDRPLFREASHSVIGTAPSIGTLGFITRSSPRARMTEAIRQIPNGSVYLPPDIIRTQKGSRPPAPACGTSRTAAGTDTQAGASIGRRSRLRRQPAPLNARQPESERKDGQKP
ncbi:response regulator transcription factor [Phytopseudomonas dryadis]|uniref:response regulator transcription factor n=1 Tax=Pseudomonadaceae TaxID=135621 RepID=UPI001A954620